MRRAAAKAEPGDGPAGTAHPGADRHPLPPRDPGGHHRERFASQPPAAQREESTGSRSCHVKASRVQAASAKAQTSSRHSRLNRESEMTASLVIIPARPPLFHRRWWPGTPNTGGSGMVATSSFSGASPGAPAAHSYLLQRAACRPCCGGMLWAEGSSAPRLPGRWLCEHPSNKET